MSRAKKIYQSKAFLSLTIVVEINGVVHNCEFTGGMTFPQVINGVYGTSNPEIQQAIESHKGFNRDFYIQKILELPDPVIPEAPVKAIHVPLAKPEDIEVPQEAKAFISKAKSAQDAREELNQAYGVPFNKIKNTDAILAKAKELNVQYPDWINK